MVLPYLESEVMTSGLLSTKLKKKGVGAGCLTVTRASSIDP